MKQILYSTGMAVLIVPFTIWYLEVTLTRIAPMLSAIFAVRGM